MKHIKTFESFLYEAKGMALPDGYLKHQKYINEALKIGDFVRYKKDKDFSGGKILYFKGGKATVKAWDGSELEFDTKDLEYVKSWNESVNEREYSDE